MSWPGNSELTQGIIYSDFFSALEASNPLRFHTKLSKQVTQEELSEVYTSFGAVPEPWQRSGISGGGSTKQDHLKDWTMTATVNTWESEVHIPRMVALSKPDAVREKVRQMGVKATKSNDKNFCVALCSTTALGYDGIAIFSASHAESGSNQTNLTTTNTAATTTITAAEAEAALIDMVDAMHILQDDQGTPVCEGVDHYYLLASPGLATGFRMVTDMRIANQSVDTTGITGLFRGQVEVIMSAYCTDSGLTGGNADVAYLIADPAQSGEYPLARCTLADWMFYTNLMNDNSDEWNKGDCYLRSEAVQVFVPWKWQTIIRHTFT